MFDDVQPKKPAHARRVRLNLEQLEVRNLLSATTLAHHPINLSPPPAPPVIPTSTANTNSSESTTGHTSGHSSADNLLAQPLYTVEQAGPGNSPVGFTPAQIAQAYGFNGITFTNPKGGSIVGNGAGQTIAIVDPYSDPFIKSDLATFDTEFTLPRANLIIAQPGGPPVANLFAGLEISLDVEWAHAMAPGATILLVEAKNSSLDSLMNAVTFAANYKGIPSQGVAPTSVVSMSWGFPEFTGETTFDKDFTTPKGHINVTFVAAAGDSSEFAGVLWPAISPKVLSVGGTSLTLNTTTNPNAWQSESTWYNGSSSGGGGGYSQIETTPIYQQGVNPSKYRANPDVSYDANPNTGFAVYDSFGTGFFGGPWLEVGGTSAGAPQWSAIAAIADQGRLLAGKATLNSLQADVYQLPYSVGAVVATPPSAGVMDFHNITTGINGPYSAGLGYNIATGLGTPVVNLVINSLINQNNVS